MTQEPVVPRAYYSIGEVCDLTGLKPHVLRYWETQFRELAPGKNRAGNRVYRPREVETILLLKNLLHEKRFTLEGARQHLKGLRQGEGIEASREGVLEPHFMESLKEDLQDLKEILSLPESTGS
ncbi:MAG: MerR family transcriptional regulator [Gemmatimonadota bacterium]